MQSKRAITTILLSLLALSVIPAGYSQHPQTISEQGFGLNRNASLTIKIVFLGITQAQLNSTYLTSNVTVPLLKYQTILAGPLNTGVIYNFNYQLAFADNSTVANFAQYLRSIARLQITLPRPSTPSGLVNPYFTNSSTLQQANDTFYDANKVESWLGSNIGLFGASPVSGYTLFVSDLSGPALGIPSYTYPQYQGYNLRCTSPCPKTTVTPHYYNRTITDPDLHLVNTRHFMTGWGGSGRFYFVDLSAGPSYWTNELPVQVAGPLRGVAAGSYYGRLWMSKFVGSYVSGAVHDLFAADQLYPVNYAQTYKVQLFVIDNRTTAEMAQPSLRATINQTLIQETLSSLLPFAQVSVNINYANINTYPNLATVVANATTNLKDPLTGRPIVDGDLVYRWLTTNGLGHISDFLTVTRSIQEIDIPGFVFAFKNNYTFGIPVKENIGSSTAPHTFAGEALGDMVIIGLSQSDFTLGNNATYGQSGRGDGFTHAAIHELGHMMGLNHPFIYDQTEDFTDTVMGYYAYSLNYSQFDRDTILRGVNDELLSFALETLSSTQNTLFNSGDISLADQNIAQATSLYDTMNYGSAIPYSLAAAQDAYSAQHLGNGPVSPALVFSLIGIAIGVAVGFFLGYLIFRRRKPAGNPVQSLPYGPTAL